MRVWKDEETKNRIVENYRKRNEERDKERHKDPKKLHVSELTFCLRESALRRRHPEPATLRKLGYFLSGHAWHGILEGLEHGRKEFSIKDEEEGVELHGTIDLLGENTMEIKSTRSDKEAMSPQYLRQLFYYLVILNDNTGRIFVFKTKMKYIEDPFVCMVYELTPEELAQHRADMWGRAKALAKANVDPRDFRCCADLEGILPMIDLELSWKCKDCLYKQKPLVSWD